MSHTKLRKENNCLNCNAIVSGRYCSVCGQENIEIHETFGHLAGHLISDIFHFDGMFFSTAKYLLFRPGFLTYEYLRGRRASYLHPVKMYVFISAVFFLLFLSFFKPEFHIDNKQAVHFTAAQVKDTLLAIRSSTLALLSKPSLNLVARQKVKEKVQLIDKDLLLLQKDTLAKSEWLREVNDFYISPDGSVIVSEKNYHSVAEYDSLQQKLPPAKRDGWLQRKIAIRSVTINKQFRQNGDQTAENLEESFFHHFPQMLFISLPLFSLVLGLLYVRRKAFNYGSHLIFTVHLYCALFIFFFLLILLYHFAGLSGLHWLSWLADLVIVYIIFYTYQAMHVFYAQGIGKTFVKWIILYTLGIFIMLILFVLLLMFALFTL